MSAGRPPDIRDRLRQQVEDARYADQCIQLVESLALPHGCWTAEQYAQELRKLEDRAREIATWKGRR
ncbi:MAG: hypothetical protein AB7P99_13985 [Vicinamibacterales bacterium]